MLYWSLPLAIAVVCLATSLLCGLWLAGKYVLGRKVPRAWIVGVCVVFLASLATILLSPAIDVTIKLSSSGDDEKDFTPSPQGR